MTIKDFIKDNRTEIDKAILADRYRYDGRGGKGTIPNPPPKMNDNERRLYIINYEPLYHWARSAGVRI